MGNTPYLHSTRHLRRVSLSVVRIFKLKSHRIYTSLLLGLLVVSLGGGCTGIPEGTQAVTGFQLERYLGTWYEIARLDHRFERGLAQVTATYSMRSDGGVKVVNRGYQVAKSQWDEAIGKAYLMGEPNIGRLKVSFFGPFYGGYNILALDKTGYQYALVAGPDRSYLWLLARTPSIEPATLKALVSQAKTLGFPVDELIYVDQSQPPPKPATTKG